MTAFLKMHGLGNDFAVFDARNQPLALDAAAARALADRRFGVGCDQVIVIEPAANGADAFMRIYNSDGGEVESCGNAARCVAGLLIGEKGAQEIKLDTTGGALICKSDGAHVSIDMGVPKFGWREIPLARETDTLSFPIEIPGSHLYALKIATAVNVGNPHVVLFVDDAGKAPVAELGPQIERHALFPERTNVEFVTLIDKDRLRMRVWERGVGITMACGTGACAAMVAAYRRGLAGHKAEVVLDGGSLTLEWGGEGKPVIMTGPWALSYKGDVDLEALRR
ncbi:MAG: diaminopimelate epimerase [Proteobacteria bacterium]|nr:diaminopimelate epimerase [Pseudomonadota bacterium]